MNNRVTESQYEEHNPSREGITNIMEVVLFCGYSGYILGSLAYIFEHPFSQDLPVFAGIILAGAFGAIVGMLSSPIVALCVFRKDLRLARPLILLPTGLVIIALGLSHYWHTILYTFFPSVITFIGLAFIAMLWLPRHWDKPGLCQRCGYDIRASAQFRRCPECGTGFSEKPWFFNYYGVWGKKPFARHFTAWILRHPAITLTLITAMFFSQLAFVTIRHKYRTRVVTKAIQTAIATEEQLDLGQALGFDWDAVYVLYPYSDIQQTTGISWPEAQNSGLESQDAGDVLIFVDDDSVVEYAITRGCGWFCDSLYDKPVTRQEAIFKVRIEEDRPRLCPAN